MIILDVETSGVDEIKDSLLSIGAIDFDNPENQFYGECHVWTDAHINEEALKINGFTKEQATDKSKKSDVELVEEFIKWTKTCKEHTFAGQNPSFDRDFIHRAAERGHIDWPFAKRTIDQHTLCYMHMVKKGIVPPISNQRSDLNSDKIMQYVGIPAEIHPHNALNGAKISGEAISRLLYDKKLLPEYEKHDIPWIVL